MGRKVMETSELRKGVKTGKSLWDGDWAGRLLRLIALRRV